MNFIPKIIVKLNSKFTLTNSMNNLFIFDNSWKNWQRNFNCNILLLWHCHVNIFAAFKWIWFDSFFLEYESNQVEGNTLPDEMPKQRDTLKC